MELNEKFQQQIDQGQQYLAEAIKILVYKADPELFATLDINDDSIFLEPFLFGYFNTAKPLVSLHQILYGYTEPSLRPANVTVYAEENGIIYLPRIGYLKTSLFNRQLTLVSDPSSEQFLLKDGITNIAFTFEELLFVPGTSFEIGRYPSVFYSEYFREWNDEKKDFEKELAQVNIEETVAFHLSKVTRAFEILRECSPEQYHHYLLTTRRFVLFHNPNIRNFAVRNLHGTAFISARPDHTAIFFLEEIVHQSSHNVFNAITGKLSDHFQIDPETPLVNYSQRNGEFRSIYSAHHGLYTVTTRLVCFDQCLDSFSGPVQYEIAARLADLRRRFRNGMEKIEFDKVFTPLGHLVYKELDHQCDELFEKRKYLLNQFDYSNQNAGFNFEKFMLLNSPRHMEEVLGSLVLK